MLPIMIVIHNVTGHYFNLFKKHFKWVFDLNGDPHLFDKIMKIEIVLTKTTGREENWGNYVKVLCGSPN